MIYTGGNPALKNAGSDPSVMGTFLALNSPGVGATATIIAHENVAARMTGALGTNPPTPPDSWPIDTYLTERRRQIGRRGQRLRHREQYLRALDVLALFGEAQRGVDGRPAGRGDFARGGEMARGERPAASKGREQTQSNAARRERYHQHRSDRFLAQPCASRR